MAWLDAAVLYCDISGYTSLTNQTRNETVARILIAFHSSMVRITNHFNGRVFGFAGDRVMSVFSMADRNSTVDAAISCALSMHSIVRYIIPEEFETRNFKPSLACTIGLDYGRVLMGRFGAGQSKDVVFVGDAANLAAKLQAIASPDKSVVSNTVYDAFPSWITRSRWTSKNVNLSGVDVICAYESGTYYTLE
ncbi:MAG: adenylate/guanylate cyclase domain-containing protein [Candidatus Hodarchaeota archaeon]